MELFSCTRLDKRLSTELPTDHGLLKVFPGFTKFCDNLFTLTSDDNLASNSIVVGYTV